MPRSFDGSHELSLHLLLQPRLSARKDLALLGDVPAQEVVVQKVEAPQEEVVRVLDVVIEELASPPSLVEAPGFAGALILRAKGIQVLEVVGLSGKEEPIRVDPTDLGLLLIAPRAGLTGLTGG